jgi:hypothetical protein
VKLDFSQVPPLLALLVILKLTIVLLALLITLDLLLASLVLKNTIHLMELNV